MPLRKSIFPDSPCSPPCILPGLEEIEGSLAVLEEGDVFKTTIPLNEGGINGGINDGINLSDSELLVLQAIKTNPHAADGERRTPHTRLGRSGRGLLPVWLSTC